ncbi:MAG: DEAD/DEAH box helicase [Candidatus Cloacimonetes bacterium]|nr:DEAD/DEAH box helicase [Candidatus Cloacimonadota bacterium]
MTTPANKTDSLPLSSKLDFIVLDIETTGLDFEKHEIIEIAALHFQDGGIKDTFSTFVKPRGAVPAFIKKLTHITDEMLKTGTGIHTALSKLKNFIGDKPVVCHNTGFDIEFINTKLQKEVIPQIYNKTWDTLSLARIYLPDARNHKLTTLAEYFGLELAGAHRAINDAEATGWLLLKEIDFIIRNIDIKTNHLLYEMSLVAREYSDLDDILNIILEEQKKTALTYQQKPDYVMPDITYVQNELEEGTELALPDIFGESGSLAEIYDDYEFRAGQLKMAECIKSAFEDEKHLLVEAGTGVGKSLAYLIPAMQYSWAHECRVIISTNTKNLQEQIFTKDLPLLKKCLKIPFEAVLLKGRGNYICEKKWQEVMRTWQRSAAAWETRDLMKLIVWKKFSQTGDIVENTSFNTAKMSSTWKKVVADRHFCRGRRCTSAGSCHFMRKRILAENANLIVINHHLLLADAVSDNSVLGEYEKLVIDEAHNLPNTAHTELGFSLSWPDFQGFFMQLFHIRKDYQSGELIAIKKDLQSSKLAEAARDAAIIVIENLINDIDQCQDVFKPFFWEMGEVVKICTKYGKLSYFTDPEEYKYARLNEKPNFSFIQQLPDLLNCLQAILKSVKNLALTLKGIESSKMKNYDQHLESIDRIVERLGEFHENLEAFLNPDYDANAYWFSILNVADAEYPAGVLNVVPLDISSQMSEYFYDKKESIIFTSATLAIRGIFKYYERRMGLPLNDNAKVRLEIVESPFDYNKQSLVINTAFLPLYSDPYFFDQSMELITQASKLVPGGTLVLFTSYQDMENAFQKLAEKLPDDTALMIQSRSSSRTSLLKQFSDNGKGVLLGTSSFWEGVDVPGEALSQIIIYKLPFPSPGDPVVEAYTKKLSRNNKQPFEYYTLPEALLKYRQGYGRLIRSRKDTGVVIVLDNRISTKYDRYGKYFVQVIPAQTIFSRNPAETISRIANWFLEQKLYR